jgi:predicted nucleic acid-binding protein
MDIVVDASALLAVVLNEARRDWVIENTVGQGVIAPEILPYETGNALISLRKKGRLSERDILRAFDMSLRVTVTLAQIDIREALKIAMRFKIYAYDAYYLQCCLENKAALISLDDRMCEIAGRLGIKIVE